MAEMTALYLRNTPLKCYLASQGYKAFRAGIPASECPYSYDENEESKFCYMWWMDGWENGYKDASLYERALLTIAKHAYRPIVVTM